MVYPIRQIKYQKKTSDILEHVQKIIDSYEIPLSVRQIFYRLVSMGVIKNTHNQYRRVSTIVTNGRYTGHIDWDKVIDDTRAVYKTADWNDINDAIKNTLEDYRRDRWGDSDYYIELWVEKRTMTNLFYSVTNSYDVRLVVGGGFNSATAIWEAFKRLAVKQFEDKKKIVILYFGDLDPSGWFMSNDVEKRLKEFDLNFTMERVILNYEHVQKYNLPKSYKVMVKYEKEISNKLEKDPRSKFFYDSFGELFQVEFEAIDPGVVTEHIRDSIEKYLNKEDYQRIVEIEDIEKLEIRKRLNL